MLIYCEVTQGQPAQIDAKDQGGQYAKFLTQRRQEARGLNPIGGRIVDGRHRAVRGDVAEQSERQLFPRVIQKEWQPQIAANQASIFRMPVLPVVEFAAETVLGEVAEVDVVDDVVESVAAAR